MEIIYKIIIVLVPMILSLSVHEYAHAWSAYKLGDDTAKRHGRLTLNPLAHIDIIGTLVLPIFLTIQGGGFFFGWAKPVPVNRNRFNRNISMRTGDIITAVAGPVSNIIIAFVCVGVLSFMMHKGMASANSPITTLLQHMFFINLALAVFNILPVPPLDGHYLLPESIQNSLRRYQMVVFVAFILMINLFSGLLRMPIIFLAELMIGFWSLLFGGI